MRRTVRTAVALGIGIAVVAMALVLIVPDAGQPAPSTPQQIQLAGSDDRDDDARDDDARDDDARDDDAREDADEEESVAETADGRRFTLEIDPELDARFGPRPVGGVRAAEIAEAEFGGRVVQVELDEEGGRPIWEVELAGAAVGEVDVDAIDGSIR